MIDYLRYGMMTACAAAILFIFPRFMQGFDKPDQPVSFKRSIALVFFLLWLHFDKRDTSILDNLEEN